MQLAKNRSRRRLAAVVVVVVTAALASGGTLLVVGSSTGATGRADPTSLPFNSYAVKFTCGEFGKFFDPTSADVPEGPVAPAYYQTSINVHNPNEKTNISLNKKAVLLYKGNSPVTEGPGTSFPFEHEYMPGNLVPAALHPDGAFMIDCQDIRSVLSTGAPPAPTFIEGYVIIQNPQVTFPVKFVPPLDVTAVYTSNGYTCTTPCSASGPVTRSGFAQDVEVISPTLINH